MTTTTQRILVTGATGYIGGRLVPRLLAAGYRVRCLVRTPRKLESREWYGDPGVEVVQSGIAGDENLAAAMEGCSTAYYSTGGLWKLRGWMDRLVGGPGLGRGRRDPDRLSFGEAVDFWRVAECTSPRTLRLLAEMKLPGIAVLDFEIEPADGGRHTRLTQTARFEPRGLLGLAYWYTVAPLHGLVFPRMLRAIARETTHGSEGG